MADFRAYDSRINLRAIFVGALASFSVNGIMLLFSTGIATGAVYYGYLRGFGPVLRPPYFIVQTLMVALVGGYIGGHYSVARNLFDARIHGFAATCLASIVMAFMLAIPGNYLMKSFVNGTQPSARAVIARPGIPGVPGIAAEPPQARVLLFRSIYMLEGVLVSAWAGGLAYSRQRRDRVELTGEETRAA